MANDVTKLPKWAQDRIKDLELERDLAFRNLKEFEDNQTESPLRQLVSIPNAAGGTMWRYVQGQSISAEWKGVSLDMWLVDDGIRISFSDKERRMSGGAALFPESGNSVTIRQVKFDRKH